MERLTQAEEQVMQALWERKKAFVKELLEDMPEPKPAYTTVSTVIRILEQKGFVDHEAFGRSHRYFPLVTKKAYSKKYVDRFVKDYFAGSPKQLLSFFLDNKKMDMKETNELLELLKEHKKK